MRKSELARYRPTMPDHVDYRPGVMTGVDAVTPPLRELYNEDPAEMGPLIGSLDRETSPNGKISFDQCVVAQKVKAYNAKNGSLALIADANLAQVSRWCSYAARRLGVGRSQLLAKAKHAYLAAQSGGNAVPDSTPAE